jgi:hypothetical protein
MGGFRGSSAVAGLFVDTTGVIAVIFAVTIAALNVYDFGWRNTIGLLALTLMGGWIWAAVGAFIAAFIGKVALWMIGTVLVYVAAVVLFFQFSWFGLL